MGNEAPERTIASRIPWLPRSSQGDIDQTATLRLLTTATPAFIAMWGVFWISGQGLATARADVTVAILTAMPLWVMARAWRLPWWLHVAAMSFPVSVGVIGLAHGDPTGLVRGAKFAYGAILFLGVVAWARTPRRRLALMFAIPPLVSWVYFLSLSTWFAVADSPFDKMKGTLDFHNQFAVHMLFGFATGMGLAVLGRRWWAVVAGVCAAICGVGVVMSGSRFGFSLAAVAAVVWLLTGFIRVRAEKQWRSVVGWSSIVLGIAAGAVLLRSPLIFSSTGVWGAPLSTMTRRGGMAESGGARVDWWVSSWQIALDHPLFGTGLLTFDKATVCYGTWPQWHPHNEWAYAVAEGGLVGLAPMLLLAIVALGIVLWAVRRPPSASMLVADPGRWVGAVAAVAFVADQAVEYDLYYTVLVGLLAITLGCGLAGSRTVAAPRHGRASVAFVLLAATLAVAVTAIFFDPSFASYPWEDGYETACVATQSSS